MWSLYGEGNGTPLHDSCLENPLDGGAWKAAVYGVAEGRTRLIEFTFTFPFHALEKEMATHSSVLAWRVPGTGEPGGLPSMGSHGVGHDWSDLAVTVAVVFSDWLLLPSNMYLEFFQVFGGFLLINNIPLYECTYHCLLIHQPIKGHLVASSLGQLWIKLLSICVKVFE